MERCCFRSLRYAAIPAARYCRRRCSSVFSQTVTWNRIHGERLPPGSTGGRSKEHLPTRCGLLAAGGEARPALSCTLSLKFVRHTRGAVFHHKGPLPPLPDAVHRPRIEKREGGEGVTRLLVYCASGRCHHGSTIEFDWIADDAAVRNLCPRVRIRVGRQF